MSDGSIEETLNVLKKATENDQKCNFNEAIKYYQIGVSGLNDLIQQGHPDSQLILKKKKEYETRIQQLVELHEEPMSSSSSSVPSSSSLPSSSLPSSSSQPAPSPVHKLINESKFQEALDFQMKLVEKSISEFKAIKEADVKKEAKKIVEEELELAEKIKEMLKKSKELELVREYESIQSLMRQGAKEEEGRHWERAIDCYERVKKKSGEKLPLFSSDLARKGRIEQWRVQALAKVLSIEKMLETGHSVPEHLVVPMSGDGGKYVDPIPKKQSLLDKLKNR